MKLASRIKGAWLGGVVLALAKTVLGASSGLTNSETAYLADLFAGRIVSRLQIEIPRAGMRDLSKHDWDNRHRPSALATVKEGGHIYTNVAIHLKGGAGSFRPVDENPGLTLNFEKNAPGQSFHGLKKFSLNNSVQDPTFLNEKICRELYNSAGSLTPRAGFTTVVLNGRSLGIHVLTEGFNKQFLRHYFEDVRGNLYQTHANQEITERLDVNSGDDPKNDSGLRALAQAVKEGDPAVRWNRLEQTLEVNGFMTFMAMEVMLCHWDGYCMNQNNYRVFHDLGANRIVFIAHGMDQMFGTGTMRLGGEKSSSDCPIYPQLRGAVADAVMSTPEGRRLYLARLGELYTNLFHVDLLLKRVDELSAVVRSAMTESGAELAVGNYQRKVDSLKAHIAQRSNSLARQLAEASKPRDPRLLEPVHLTGWVTRVQEGQPEFDKGTEASRPRLLHISAPHRKIAGSWRTNLELEPGRYRFEGEIRVQGVKSGVQGAGAGLRISGGRPLGEVSGSTDWRPFAYEFQVGGNKVVEFICELRAVEGEAWFDAEKLQVVRID
jgi:spore coat protein CotH